MQKAGWQEDPLFTRDSVTAIHKFTDGIPRKINTFLDRVLLFSYMEEKRSVDVEVIQEVIKEVSSELNHQMDGEGMSSRTGGMPRSTPASRNFVDRDLMSNDPEMAAIDSALMGADMNTAKIEALLESLIAMNRRSVILQNQILKELKLQNSKLFPEQDSESSADQKSVAELKSVKTNKE